uniref:Uncharacterized protein n=1 Tax=viral metagenome TaxID=1070528 RepID=A0A6C0JMK0_9ZZZZ
MYYNYILNNYNSMSQTQIDTLMNDYKTLSDNLNDFNIKYAKYIKSVQANSIPSSNCSSTDPTCFTEREKGDITQDFLNNKENTIIGYIDKVNADIEVIKNSKDNVTQTIYNDNYKEILEKENSINVTRKDLDSKIKELQNSIKANDIKTQYDSTLYTGIIFSVVATTMLYYTFTKL